MVGVGAGVAVARSVCTEGDSGGESEDCVWDSCSPDEFDDDETVTSSEEAAYWLAGGKGPADESAGNEGAAVIAMGGSPELWATQPARKMLTQSQWLRRINLVDIGIALQVKKWCVTKCMNKSGCIQGER